MGCERFSFPTRFSTREIPIRGNLFSVVRLPTPPDTYTRKMENRQRSHRLLVQNGLYRKNLILVMMFRRKNLSFARRNGTHFLMLMPSVDIGLCFAMMVTQSIRLSSPAPHNGSNV